MKIRTIFLILILMSVNKLDINARGISGKEPKTFIKHTDACFAQMEKTANDMDVKGACVLAYIPGDVSKTWISAMHIVGAIKNEGANFLAIAYSKAAEMADTYKNSGSGVREPLHGEFGYQGGVIKKVKSGYILAVFSGASGEQDFEIASKGLEMLATFF